jgi:CRP-like cAMP-binding protein
MTNLSPVDQATHIRLRALRPISQLPLEYRDALIYAGTIETLNAGQYLCRQGEVYEHIYLLNDGEVETLSNNIRARRIKTNDREADEELAPGYPRPVSIRALRPTTVFSLPKAVLDDIRQRAVSGFSALNVSAKAHAAQNNSNRSGATQVPHPADSASASAGPNVWVSQLLRSELFKRIPTGNIHRIISLMERISVNTGDVIIRQGSGGDYYFFILRGHAEVTRKSKPNAPYVKLAELRDGQSFGEDALVSDAKRNATVTMLSAGELIRLSKQNFVELIRKPTLNSVSYAQAQTLITEGARWLDVRCSEDHGASGIAGSLNLPLDTLRGRINEFDAFQRYVVYCDTGRESSAAAFLLAESGFDVCYLAGGLLHMLSTLRAEARDDENRSDIDALTADAASFVAALEDDSDIPAPYLHDNASEPDHAYTEGGEGPSKHSVSPGDSAPAELAHLVTLNADLKIQLAAATRLNTIEEQARIAAESAMTDKLADARMEYAAMEDRTKSLSDALTEAQAHAWESEQELKLLLTELSQSKVNAHSDVDAYDKAIQHKLYEERQRTGRAVADLATAQTALDELRAQIPDSAEPAAASQALVIELSTLASSLNEQCDAATGAIREQQAQLAAIEKRETAADEQLRNKGNEPSSLSAALEEAKRNRAEAASRFEVLNAKTTDLEHELAAMGAARDTERALQERSHDGHRALEQEVEHLRSSQIEKDTQVALAVARADEQSTLASSLNERLTAAQTRAQSATNSLESERENRVKGYATLKRRVKEQERIYSRDVTQAKNEASAARIELTTAAATHESHLDAMRAELSVALNTLKSQSAELTPHVQPQEQSAPSGEAEPADNLALKIQHLNERFRRRETIFAKQREQFEQLLLEKDIVLDAERAKFTSETARLNRQRDEAAQRLRRERRSMSIESKEVDQQLELALKLRSEAEAAMQAAVQLVKERGLETSRADSPIRIVGSKDDS